MSIYDFRLLPGNFAKKISPDSDGCWIFTGALNSKGYGCIAVDGDGSIRLAHRAAYELLVDRIPEGMTIDHLCLVKACCNPAHLEVVGRAENSLRALPDGFVPVQAQRNAGKTHCKRGHEFTEENTRIHPTRGYRICVTCKRELDREAQARRRRSR